MANFFNTQVFIPVEYSEIKAVAITKIQSLPNKKNVNTVTPLYNSENINNLKIVELEKKGGPIEGSIISEGHEIKYGIEYERDELGNIILDEENQAVVRENNGVLYGQKVNEATKSVTFNAIVVYSTEIHPETNTPSIAIVTLFNNSLSFEKILNFFVKYIINVDKEILELILEYYDEYGKHQTETNTNNFMLKEKHPQLMQRVMLSAQGDVAKDNTTQLQKQYELFIKDRDNYLFIKPVKDNKFNDELLSTSIQTHHNAKLYKYEDTTVKTPYLYFYYNLKASKKIIIEGIKSQVDKTEDAGAVEAISLEAMRKHIKIGFSETAGTFLYTWFSTKKFIYVICYGSNSNTNVDIYRVRNRKEVDINDVNYNLTVARYLDRIYFTIDGDLHVCVPQVKGRTTESVAENEQFRKEARESLKTHDFLYVDFDTMTDKEIMEAYDVVWEDINALNGATYQLNKEQLFIFILSKNEAYKKFITGGKFIYPDDEPYTPPDGAGQEKPKSAFKFFELGLYQPDEKKQSMILMQDKKNIYQYIKRPIDLMNEFINYMDELTNECIEYQDTNGVASYKTTYVNQISIKLIERLRPAYPVDISDISYKLNWWGQNKNSGARDNVLKYTMKYGNAENPEIDKYDNYIEERFSEDYENNIIDIIYNISERSKIEKELPVNNKTFDTYMMGVVERLQKKGPSYSTSLVLSSFQEYFFKAIYKEADIVSVENQFRRFYRYSMYRALYDTVVATSKSYQSYVIRTYLINEEKQGNNDGDTLDAYNNMTIPEIDNYWNEKILSPLTNAMDVGEWWDEKVLAELEELYNKVIETPLYITYAYSKTDECYYNGIEKKDVPITERDKEIPYRYGFPLPSYIYNAKESDIFVVPATEEVEITETFYSKTQMEEKLLIPIKDGEAETEEKLESLVALRKDYEVENADELNKLSEVTVITKEAKNGIDGINKYYETLPNKGEEGAYYYIKNENGVYTYSTNQAPEPEANNGWTKLADYPLAGSNYRVDSDTYKVSTQEIEKEYTKEIENTFTSEKKAYKLLLTNIKKIDILVDVEATNASDANKVEYTFEPPIENIEYTLKFEGLAKKEETGTLNIIIKQGEDKLLEEAVGDKTNFNVTPPKKELVTITVENATALGLSVTYIKNNGNQRTIKVTETVSSVNEGGEQTEVTNTLFNEEIDLTNPIASKEIDLTCKGGVVLIVAEGIEAESVIKYQDSFQAITWNVYKLPQTGDMAFVKGEDAYYEYEQEWTVITLEGLRNRYTNKIYLVLQNNQYYKFSGLTWMPINPMYDIPYKSYYKVLNEDETINGTLSAEEENNATNDYLAKFTEIRANQKYTISGNVSMVDDREIINVTVENQTNKYLFTPIDLNKEYEIIINGLQQIDQEKKIKIKLQYDAEDIIVPTNKEGDNYAFTPPVENKEYTIIVAGVQQEGAKIILKKGDDSVAEQEITNGEATIKYTAADTSKLIIEGQNTTINKVDVTYIKPAEVLKEEEVGEISKPAEGEQVTEKINSIVKYTPTDKKKITIAFDNGYTDIMPTISYLKAINSGLTRKLLIKQGTKVLREDTLTFATVSESLNKEYEVTSTNTDDIFVEIKKGSIRGLSAAYSYIRQPDGKKGQVDYYIWIGDRFVATTVAIIAPYNSCKWYIEDIEVYFNIYVEGEKLNVIRDLFLDIDGAPCKVVQFDFSDIGDVVLVLNYNKTGQNCWGGVFSRYATATQVDTTKKIYSYGAVMSNNFIECFNWDAYNYIQFTTDGNGNRIISDERLRAIEATYEVSRSHYERLVHKFGSNMVFSNALTIAWEKSDIDPPYTHTMFIYPKNIKMFPNMITLPYNEIRFLVNNYFLIEGDAWFDMIYNRYYKMNTGVQPEYYKRRFLAAQRSLVVVAISDHDDKDGFSGAISYFNCNTWYNKDRVTDYIEKVNIPQKDI